MLKLAREAIENFVKERKIISIPINYPKELDEKRGVFITIYKKESKKLRGCIGLPYSEKPLIKGLIEAAVSVCKDPRFEPLKPEELNNIFIEISILTESELIKPTTTNGYLKDIEIGKHGLIIKRGLRQGLLLPQVWKSLPRKEDFLEALCMKAGLLADGWLDPLTEIYRFQVEAFEEDF